MPDPKPELVDAQSVRARLAKPTAADYVPEHVAKVERDFPRGTFVAERPLSDGSRVPLFLVERVVDFEGAAWLIVLDRPQGKQGKPFLVRPEVVVAVHRPWRHGFRRSGAEARSEVVLQQDEERLRFLERVIASDKAAFWRFWASKAPPEAAAGVRRAAMAELSANTGRTVPDLCSVLELDPATLLPLKGGA